MFSPLIWRVHNSILVFHILLNCVEILKKLIHSLSLILSIINNQKMYCTAQSVQQTKLIFRLQNDIFYGIKLNVESVPTHNLHHSGTVPTYKLIVSAMSIVTRVMQTPQRQNCLSNLHNILLSKAVFCTFSFIHLVRWLRGSISQIFRSC